MLKYFLLLFILSFPLLNAEESFKLRTGDYSATAFYYTNTRLFTAAHTFKKSKTTDCFIIKDNQKIKCKILKIDYKKDICVLESETPNETCLILNPLKFTSSGFPSGKSYFESPNGTITKFETNNTSIHGMSGGALYEEKSKEVFGMVVDGGPKKCQVILSNVLLDFIKDLN